VLEVRGTVADEGQGRADLERGMIATLERIKLVVESKAPSMN
jgi:hypothetical protein